MTVELKNQKTSGKRASYESPSVTIRGLTLITHGGTVGVEDSGGQTGNQINQRGEPTSEKGR